MRKFIILLLAFIFLPTVVNAQNPITKDTVVQIQNISADLIYDKVCKWFDQNIAKDTRNILQVKDDENKVIMVRYNMDISVRALTSGQLSGTIKSTIEIACRDGRFRVKNYDFTHSAIKARGMNQSQGIIYDDVPAAYTGTRKVNYKQMLRYALPQIDEYWDWLIMSLKSNVAVSSTVHEEW